MITQHHSPKLCACSETNSHTRFRTVGEIDRRAGSHPTSPIRNLYNLDVHSRLNRWEVEVGGTRMEEVRGASFAGSSPPFLGRERAAVGVHVERDDGPLETPGGKGLPSLPSSYYY